MSLKMEIQEAANDYSQYFDTSINKKLTPVIETIDDMLTRLEEFETLVTMVQESTGRSIGPSGTIPSLVTECSQALDVLCLRSDALEHLTVHLQNEMDILEAKIETVENELGSSKQNKLKDLFYPFLKKSEPKPTHRVTVPSDGFNTDSYFTKTN